MLACFCTSVSGWKLCGKRQGKQQAIEKGTDKLMAASDFFYILLFIF
jgi:hypothetical protein